MAVSLSKNDKTWILEQKNRIEMLRLKSIKDNQDYCRF